jgi:hypothetical protein
MFVGDARYEDIVPDARIVFSYTVARGETRITAESEIRELVARRVDVIREKDVEHHATGRGPLGERCPAQKVDARAEGRAIILTGAMPSIGARARASERARDVPGVRSVENELTYDAARRQEPRVSTTGSHAQVMARQRGPKRQGP